MADPFAQDVTETDDAYALRPQTVDAIILASATGDRGKLLTLLEPLHPADIADLLEQVKPSERVDIALLWGEEFDADVLTEVEEKVATAC